MEHTLKRVREIECDTSGAGLYEITGEIEAQVAKGDVGEGLCTLFLRHTSASLLIQENADPAVLRDLEAFFRRLVPESDALYTHTAEGPDDMPAHIKGALTASSLSIPILGGHLALGTWQGVFLWEHRAKPHTRKIVIHLGA